MKFEFPNLTSSQVALVRVDKNTGHLLDENFFIATSENQKVYTIFENANAAIVIADLIVKEKKDIECSIFDSFQNLIRLISSD